MTRHLPALLLLTGCAPGALHWATGHDVLRTAKWVPGETTTLGQHARLFLSTGAFDCALPAHDDPQDQWEALMELQAGACREDARHIVLTLYSDHPSNWEGHFPLAGSNGPQPDEQVSEALYVGVEEAAVERAEGFDPQWVPIEVTWYSGSGDPGEVHVKREHDEVLTGTFDLRGAHVSGRFEAAPCEGDSSLLELLAASPTSACTSPDE